MDSNCHLLVGLSLALLANLSLAIPETENGIIYNNFKDIQIMKDNLEGLARTLHRLSRESKLKNSKLKELLLLQSRVDDLERSSCKCVESSDQSGKKQTIQDNIDEKFNDLNRRKITNGTAFVQSATLEEQPLNNNTSNVLKSKTVSSQNLTNLRHQTKEKDSLKTSQKGRPMLKIMKRASVPHHIASTYIGPSKPIAFYIKLTGNIATDQSHLILFNQTILDSANAYNTRTGKYTVPKSGTYILKWTIYVYNHSHALTRLMINNSEYSRAFEDSDDVEDIHSSAGIVVASLTQGDTVHVRFGHTHNSGTLCSNYGDNSFLGWILE